MSIGEALRSVKVRSRIGLTVVVPVLGLLLLSSWLLIDRWRTTEALGRVGTMTRIAPAISAVIDELQKERGTTAGFLASDGNGDFAQRLEAQRKASDKAAEELWRHDLGPLRDEARAALAGLPALREAAGARKMAAADSTSAYTGTIDRLLSVVAGLAPISPDARVTAGISAYLALLEAKERAGRERALGAAGFGAGRFAPAQLRRFVELAGEQTAWFRAFRTQAGEAPRALLDDALSGPTAAGIERLRAAAAEEPATATGQQWFDAATARMQRLKPVEDKVAVDLQDLADRLASSARTQLLLLLAAVAALLAPTMVIGLVVARGIVRPLHDMAAVVGLLARGETAELPALDRGDEIGDIARALQTIHREGIEAKRIRTALDAASAAVMATDRAGRVAYANASALALMAAIGEDGRVVGTRPDFLPETSSTLTLAGHILEVVAVPVVAEGGERLGTVLQWTDRTQQMRVQREIQAAVSAASRGDLSARLEDGEQAGVYRDVSGEVNALLEVVSGFLADFEGALADLAAGRLDGRIDQRWDGLYGKLVTAVETTRDRLRGVVDGIREAAQGLKNAAAELAQSSTDLAGRTEQQAGSLEETATAMEQLTATVRQNASNASQAAQVVVSARDLAQGGGGVVAQAVEAMGEIERSATRIAEIVGMIDEIAFQTNLLALNAAVEAARAGESGKGFAVVAAEVRSLAQRTGQASREIRGLIVESDHHVRRGVELVDGTGRSLGEIVGAVKRAADLVAEISAASLEQSNGLEEVARAVTRMDHATQQNATLVEQVAATAGALESEAGHLLGEIAFFETGRR